MRPLDLAFFSLALTLGSVSCGSREGDLSANRGEPDPAGSDKRIRQVTNPDLPEHASYLAEDTTTAISGATVLALDTFDETGDGRSTGTIFVQDLGSVEPYSGISMFAPSFIPGNLRVGAGDVLDLRGQYQESVAIGAATFPPGALLAQLFRPAATFRYELSNPPAPIEIKIDDLADFAIGRKWVNMLVTVKNVALYRSAFGSGRIAAELQPRPTGASSCASPFPRPPTLTNELFDVASLNMAEGTKIRSLTGIVVFFCNLHIAPRSAADVEIER